jgi:hypothetical protein
MSVRYIQFVMIDRLELIVPQLTPQNPKFWKNRVPKRAKGGSPYVWTIDAHRELALRVHGGHRTPISPAQQHFKIDFTKTRLLTADDLICRVQELFSISASRATALRVAKIDFAADLVGTPVEWFKTYCRVRSKRHTKTYETQEIENEKGVETVIFGKRPDIYRIYNRRAEKRARSGEDLVVMSIFRNTTGPWRILTRVERQCTSRAIPRTLATLGALLENAAKFDPFDRLVCAANTACAPSTEDWTPHAG